MSSPNKPSPVAVLAGSFAGLMVFLGVNYVSGRAIIPTAESVTNISDGLSVPNRDVHYLPKEQTAVAAAGPYQTVCQSCHQADGAGMAGAFPPLAGSEWVTGDVETPIRIVLLGLTGPIDVKGTTWNAAMPGQATMSDAQIAEALTYARANFGNSATAVTAEQVKAVRDSLAGRTTAWTAPELTALRGSAAGAEQGAAPAAPTEGGAPAEPAAAPAQEGAPAAAPTP